MLVYSRVLNDAHHGKIDLKVFVVVIPKEGWVHTDFSEFYSADIIDSRKVG